MEDELVMYVCMYVCVYVCLYVGVYVYICYALMYFLVLHALSCDPWLHANHDAVLAQRMY